MEQLNLFPVVRLQRLDSKLIMKRKGNENSKRLKVSASNSNNHIPPLNRKELKKHLRLLKIFEEEDDDLLYFKDKLRSRRLKNNGLIGDPPAPDIDNQINYRKSILHCLWPQIQASAALKSSSEKVSKIYTPKIAVHVNGENGAFGYRKTRSSYSIYSLDSLKEDQDDIKKSHEDLKLVFDNEDLQDPTEEIIYPDLKFNQSEPIIPPLCDKRINKLFWSRQMSNGAVNHLINYIHKTYYSAKADDEGENNGEMKNPMPEKTTNFLLREEFKKQHRLMKIFQEEDEEENFPKFNQNSSYKLPNGIKPQVKNPVVHRLITRMQEASWNDRIVGDYPNHFQVGMLTRVLQVLRTVDNQEAFVQHGGLSVIADWLSLLPSGRLPHLAVREMMLRMLHVFPQDLEKIRVSGLASKLEVLLSHPGEQRLHKRWILQLLDRWYPPSPPLSAASSSDSSSYKEESCLKVINNHHRERSQRKRSKKVILDAQLPKWYLQLFKKEERRNVPTVFSLNPAV